MTSKLDHRPFKLKQRNKRKDLGLRLDGVRWKPLIAKFSIANLITESVYLRLLGVFRTQNSESFAIDLLLRIVVITKQISEKKVVQLHIKNKQRSQSQLNTPCNLFNGCFDGSAQVQTFTLAHSILLFRGQSKASR